MKFKNMFIYCLLVLLFASCESGFEDMMNDAGINTVTVVYSKNGAISGEVPLDSSIYYPGDTVTVLGNTGSLVESGSFIGWSTTSDGTGTCYTAGDQFVMPGANVTLYARWHTSSYSIGDTGPAGGKIFYDKGSYSDGWQYLESATSNLYEADNPDQPGYPELFKWAHAVQACNDLVSGGYSDWYLPSQTELVFLYNNRASVGSFSVRYISSTLQNSSYAYGVNFDSGAQILLSVTYNEYARPVRAF